MGAHLSDLVKCANCSAPLRGEGRAFVVCGFCGTENQLRAPPPTPAPGSGPAPGPPPGAPPGDLAGVRRVGAIVLVCTLGMIFVAVLVLFTMARKPHPTVAPSFAAKSELTSVTAFSDGLCAYDVNGDGAPDPITAVEASWHDALAAFDAKSGALLWLVPSGQQSQPRALWCGGGALLVERQGFALESADPKTGRTLWRTKLTDDVEEVGVGDACLRVKTTNAKEVSMSTATGVQAAACTPRLVIESKRTRDGRAQSRGVTVGDVAVTSGSTGRGTPRILLTGKRKPGGGWTKTLEIKSSAYTHVLAATASGVVVMGWKLEDDTTLAYALIRPETGEVVYQKEHAGAADAIGEEGVSSNGPQFFVCGFRTCLAFDAATGKFLWRAPAAK